MNKRIAIGFVVFLMMFSLASAAYETDFSTDVSADFSYSQIGRLGNDADGNLLVDWTGGALNVYGRYGRLYTQALVVSGDLNDGVYSGDVSTYIEFDVNSTEGSSTDSVRAMLSIAQDEVASANTYPVYYVDADGGTISIIKKWGYDNTTGQETIATAAYASTGITQTFRLEFSAVANGTNAYGTIVDLSARLLAGTTELAAISGTDTPTEERGSYTSGYVAFGVGQGGNTGTYTDIDAVGFGVNVPEPATMMLMAAGVPLLLRRRRGQG